jgi:hypothetical protein
VDVKNIPFLMSEVDKYMGNRRRLGISDVKNHLKNFKLVKKRYIKVREYLRYLLDTC